MKRYFWLFALGVISLCVEAQTPGGVPPASPPVPNPPISPVNPNPIQQPGTVPPPVTPNSQPGTLPYSNSPAGYPPNSPVVPDPIVTPSNSGMSRQADSIRYRSMFPQDSLRFKQLPNSPNDMMSNPIKADSSIIRDDVDPKIPK